jgi:2-polyprenyl-6-methoxyphenol hydroxylase-like FAD-dependent oxidoreductase
MRILVSGAGIAGLSAGINLGAAGHDVTIVERASHLRVNGSPIDIRGDSIEITARMGVLDEIRAHRVDMSDRVQFVDEHGRAVAELPPDVIGDSPDDFEIPREDLTHILRSALPDTTSLSFGASIAELDDDGAGVDVVFASGHRDRFDMVIGADGMHSVVRRLRFGPEREFLTHLGFYVGITELPKHDGTNGPNPMYNFPGRVVGVTTYRDTALGVFVFRSPWLDYDYHDLEQQKDLLAEAYAGHDEWRIPELIRAARQDPELYFDSVSQIHLPQWHEGRVVLVGDAAHCASNLSGRGTSLALTGTWLLAEALQNHPDDLLRAFKEYECGQRGYASRAQATAGPGGDRLVPATWEAIDARNRSFPVDVS